MEHPNEKIMREAIDFGKKNKTVGAIIVKQNEVIAKCGGTICSENDPTGHSEINAIREASRKLGENILDECWLYSTYEPCPMCTSAACWSKVKGIVYGASHVDRNDRWKWKVVIPARKVIAKSEHKPILIEEFMRDEAKTILEL